MKRRFGRLVSLASVVTMIVALTPMTAAIAAGPVFINEIHYDNVGDDTGEFVEIAGPAGTDITGWSVVLYNGNGGAVYDTISLSGTIPDQSGNGFGTLSFLRAGIQNGSPDGLALVDAGNTVIEFLSYEGDFTAAGGPADGMSSTDIGVSETPSAVGESLQLVGTGIEGGDFAWSGPVTESPGAINSGQTFGDAPQVSDGDLVVNEVDYDQPSTDTAEFVEIKNTTGDSVDLTGVDLELVNGTGGGASVYDTIELSGSLAAGDYLVVCANAATVANCDLDASPNNDMIQNGAPDAVAIVFDGSVIDTVSYEGDTGAPYTEGSGTGLVDNPATAGLGISRCPDGADTDQNNADLVGDRPITPGAPNDCDETPPQVNPGDLVVNEVDYDQDGTDASEFVEIKNTTDESVDLTGVALALVNGNGGGAAVYHTITLPGSLAAGDYLVVCANAATVANCDVDDGPDTNFIQNGAPDAVAIVFDGSVIDTVSYEGDAGAPYTEGSGTGLEDDPNLDSSGISRCPDGTDTDQNNADLVGDRPITPGTTNDCNEPPPPPDLGVCFDGTETPIHDIQGSDTNVSPENGVAHVIEGVVVGDYQGTAGLGGFFVQEEDSDADADSLSSEGIFVFDGSFGVDVAAGDVVRVRGTVTEFFGLTEITDLLDVVDCGTDDAVTATTLMLPVAAVDDFEDTEGMLVDLPQTLYASGNFTQARFGEVDLSVGGPLDNPTNVVAPGAPAIALQDLNDRSRIQLDDGSNVQNPLPLPPYLGVDGTLRTGDPVDGVTGVLSFSFDFYEIHPTEPVNFTRVNDRPDPPEVGGDLTVASYNVLNYFTTLANEGSVCGPEANQDCRGAFNEFEFDRQRAKLISAISEVDADVVGLMEIENHPGDVPTADLVLGINDATAPGTYDYIVTGAIGTDAIRQAIIYKPDVVTPVGDFAVLDGSVDPDFDDEKNRPMLVQSFMENATGEVFTVAVNHLKSKGSDCNDVGDPDTGDGQGNCNITRTRAAEAIVDYLASDPTDVGNSDYLVIGDLNSYAKEDPVSTLTGAGFTDLIAEFQGSGFEDSAYSYNFFSQSGYLDHGLASESLLPRVTGAAFWHVNADEPSGLDYNDFNQPLLFNPDEFRSSDHDPVVIGLNLVDAMGDKEAVIAALEGLLPTGHKNTDKRLNKAIGAIEASLSPIWWSSDQTITNKKVLQHDRQAVVQLMLVVDSGGAAADAAQSAIDVLVNADRQLAQIELIGAIGRDGDAGKIADAEAAMAAAEAQVAAGLYDDAIESYTAAWDAATKA